MPDSTTVAAILGSCHSISWGALAIIDRKIGVEGEKSVVKIFPADARKLIDKPGDVFADSMNALKLKYEDPEPLSEKLVLVSRTVSEGSLKMGLYLVNIDSGEERLIVEGEGGLGIFDPKIAAARPLPQASVERRSWENGAKSLVYIGDVYEGTHMKGIKRGDIKWIRVVQDHFKLTYSSGWWENEGSQAPAMNFDDYDRKQPLGIVPVREDGSVFFEVPADKFVYLRPWTQTETCCRPCAADFQRSLGKSSRASAATNRAFRRRPYQDARSKTANPIK